MPRYSPWSAPPAADSTHRRVAGIAVVLALTWTLTHGPGTALVSLLDEVATGMAAILLLMLWELGVITP